MKSLLYAFKFLPFTSPYSSVTNPTLFRSKLAPVLLNVSGEKNNRHTDCFLFKFSFVLPNNHTIFPLNLLSSNFSYLSSRLKLLTPSPSTLSREISFNFTVISMSYFCLTKLPKFNSLKQTTKKDLLFLTIGGSGIWAGLTEKFFCTMCSS